MTAGPDPQVVWTTSDEVGAQVSLGSTGGCTTPIRMIGVLNVVTKDTEVLSQVSPGMSPAAAGMAERLVRKDF